MHISDVEPIQKSLEENQSSFNVFHMAEYLRGCDNIQQAIEAINKHGIEAEVLLVPTGGLHHKYLYQFSSPFKTILSTDFITISLLPNDNEARDYNQILKDLLIGRFINMWDNTGIEGLSKQMPCTFHHMKVVRME